MGAEPAVLVTRPAGQGAELADGIASLGLRCVCEPMLVLAGEDDFDQESLDGIRRLDQCDHVIFVSSNAVAYGMPHIRNFWPELPAKPTWWAIGSVTAEHVADSGVVGVRTSEAMTSEGLLQEPELSRLSGKRVLIVKGFGGRAYLSEQLSERGASVSQFCCYRRHAPHLVPSAFMSRMHDEQVGLVLISSGEGLQNMLGLISPRESSKLAGITVVVPSERVAQIAKDQGLGSVIVAQNASNAAMLEAVKRWQQTNVSSSGD